MGIHEYRIVENDYIDRDVVSLPDNPSEGGYSATQLKERFDSLSKNVIVPKHNALVDSLVGNGETSGAANVGAKPVESGAGENVQSNLDYTMNKLNAHRVNASHMEYGRERPISAQAVGALWLQDISK